MVTFCILVAPLPHAVRKRLFRFLSESYIVAKIAYALKISFMSVASFFLSLLQNKYTYVLQTNFLICLLVDDRFVGILFVDAMQRMFRVTAESEAGKNRGQVMQDVRTETNIAARKF